MFKLLHSDEAFSHSRYCTDVKAKGYPDCAPWVRIYAVKCDDLYVISGFGIKLSQDMRDDPLLKNELNKLEKATDFLKEIGML